MTITRAGKTVTLTAVNEAVDLSAMLFAKVVGITFQGTGLTAGQRVTIRDGATVGSGEILADYAVEAMSDSADLWGNKPPRFVRGLSVDNNTVAGTWVITVFLE